MKTFLLAFCLLLGGCSSFENRVYCSPTGDDAAFVSWYMKFGVAAQISGKDAPALCKKEPK